MSRVQKDKEEANASKVAPGQQIKQPNFSQRKASSTPGGTYQSDGFQATSQKMQPSSNLAAPPKQRRQGPPANFDEQPAAPKDPKKLLYEYNVPVPEQLQANQKITIKAFRKYGFGGVGLFHTYVTQFPFKGHNQQHIEDIPANKQEVITEMQNMDFTQNKEHRHEEITDDMMMSNPFVFALSQAKLLDIRRQNKLEYGDEEVLRIPPSFDLFNRRTEFPYDTIDNALRLDPVDEGE